MFVITGSGRSGTSFAAKMANGLGIHPGGGWSERINAGLEDPDVARMNDAIHKRLQEVDPSIVVEEFRDQIKNVTAMLIKEPRFVSLPGVLKVWLEVRRDLEFLLLYRNALAAARSAAEAFDRDKSPLGIAKSARRVERNVHEAIATISLAGLPLFIANYPAIVENREYCRQALLRGPLKAIDHLLFNRVFRDTVDRRLVHHQDDSAIDLLGPSMRPGHPGYEKVGKTYAQAVIDCHGRGREIIDVGCGFGRVADALARADAALSYLGVDCFAPAVADCQQRFAMLPHFRFEHIDVRNGRYNPNGAAPASGLLGSQTDFDVALAISLFTHLNPADACTYLQECHRVLDAGGVLLATWFMVDDADQEAIVGGKSKAPLNRELEPGVFTSQGPLENAVGYSAHHIRGWYASAGLTITAIERGTWHGQGESPHFQDLIIARKE